MRISLAKGKKSEREEHPSLMEEHRAWLQGEKETGMFEALNRNPFSWSLNR